MAVTCGQVVERALRRLGVLGAGETVSAGDLSVGMDAVQELIDTMRAGLFGRLRDVLGTSDLTARTFDRVTKNESDGFTVTLPTTEDGEAIRDGALIEVRDLFSTLSVSYRYSSDTARFELLSDLTETTPLPIGDKFVGAFVALLALRIASDFGTQPSGEVYRDAAAGSRAIARAGDKRDSDLDWL